MTLRPSRRPLPWLVLAFVLSLGAVWLSVRLLSDMPIYVLSLAFAGGFGLLFSGYHLLLMFRGRTVIGPDGVTNHRITRERSASWQEFDEVVVFSGLGGRSIRLRTTKNIGFELAAPRGRDPQLDTVLETLTRARAATLRTSNTGWVGLVLPGILAVQLVIAMVLQPPWLDAWWPGRHEATRAPEACAVADRAVVERMLTTTEYGQADHKALSSSCVWQGATNESVTLDIKVFRARGDDNIEQATQKLSLPVADDPGSDLDLGDGAKQWLSARGVNLRARKANVLVTVSYETARPQVKAAADVEALVSGVLAAIRLT